VRPIAGALDGLAPLSAAWRQLVAFARRVLPARLGELALAVLPPQLRELERHPAGAPPGQRLRKPRAPALRPPSLS
jgi:primosomal protein N' (replication factor Y)